MRKHRKERPGKATPTRKNPKRVKARKGGPDTQGSTTSETLDKEGRYAERSHTCAMCCASWPEHLPIWRRRPLNSATRHGRATVWWTMVARAQNKKSRKIPIEKSLARMLAVVGGTRGIKRRSSESTAPLILEKARLLASWTEGHEVRK
jgi:hypothetical protein